MKSYSPIRGQVEKPNRLGSKDQIDGLGGLR